MTLIEACVVLAVTVVTAGLAAPNLRAMIDARRLEGAVTQLAADVQFIRTESVARNLPLRLSFYPSATGSCYVIHTGAAAQCRCDADGPARCDGEARALKTVTIARAEQLALEANVPSMLFDPVHGTVTPTGTLQLQGAGDHAVHHVINILGRMRSCAPRAAVPGYRAC